ncbi:MAG: hypothetical protein JWO38_2634 [Gemmataceae bacterium]|nr:hypothetical protein [Gemmataceae bacterium]
MRAIPAADVSRRDVHSKALAINLDPVSYGTIAEIGAGQEVARWFLTVGAASGTVAQAISAYDKTFSDATYGAGTRYVSRERLRAMLDREYQLLIERLAPTRGETTRFFVFADTASARNYKGDNEQHAWVGLRFQTAPGAEPSEVFLHVNLTDPTALLQQQALGVIGVNLIYATFFRWDAPTGDLLDVLWDELDLDRLEIDVVELRGPAFADTDARAVCLHLIRKRMARVVVFDTAGQVTEPSAVLRKRPLVVDRQMSPAVDPDPEKILRAAERQLRSEGVPLGRDPLGVLELSLGPPDGPAPDDAEVLDRVGRLAALAPVLVTGFREAYELSAYLARYTAEPIRFLVRVSHLARLLEDRFYHALPGQLLEGLGKLLAENIKLYAYPVPRAAVVAAVGPALDQYRIAEADGDLVTADDFYPLPPVAFLYRYLRNAGKIVPVAPG